MGKDRMKIVLPCFMILLLILAIFSKIDSYANEIHKSYLLVYDNLYDYGVKTSKVLKLYMELKLNHEKVRLLQIEHLDEYKSEKEKQVIVIASSFDSKEKYDDILDCFNQLSVITYDERSINMGQGTSSEGLFIGINQVYPFSDLNKLLTLSGFDSPAG